MRRILATLLLVCAAAVARADDFSATPEAVKSGGTGLSSIGTANQVLGVNNGATAMEYKTVTGTSNQITVTHSAGAITLAAPQNLGTTSSPTFGGITIVGNPVLSSASVVDAYNASFGSVTAGSTSTLTWTEVTDRLSEFVTSSFTAITAGYYQVTADGGASQTAGTGCLLLKVNAVTVNNGDACATGATALVTNLPISITRILNLSANDIVRVDASATTANTTFAKLHLTIQRVP
jgi:hypothetical protein